MKAVLQRHPGMEVGQQQEGMTGLEVGKLQAQVWEVEYLEDREVG